MVTMFPGVEAGHIFADCVADADALKIGQAYTSRFSFRAFAYSRSMPHGNECNRLTVDFTKKTLGLFMKVSAQIVMTAENGPPVAVTPANCKLYRGALLKQP